MEDNEPDFSAFGEMRSPGRPRPDTTKDFEPRITVTIGLTAKLIARARHLGGGNLSHGIRIALRRATQDPDVNFLD